MKSVAPRKSPRYALANKFFKVFTGPTPPSTQHVPVASRHAGRGRNSTAAVSEREKILLKDPLCQIINPHLTQCRGCGTEIKLSPKMLYDTCHWLAHSGRCSRPLLTGHIRRRRSEDGDDLSESGGSRQSDESLSSSNAETLEVAQYLLLLSGRYPKN